MGEINLQTMMIHVERIVRPVRAMERRKLQMRRELLGHLQAALEEERHAAVDEPAAWEAAKRRLGVPAELTRDLQKAVPLIERLTIWNAPKGRWRTPRDARLNTGLLGMRAWQQIAFFMAYFALIFGWWPLTVRHWKEGMEAPWAFLWHSWIEAALIWALLMTVLLSTLMFLAFRIIDAGAQPDPWRRLAKYGAWAMGLVLMMRAIWFMLGATPWTDLLWMPLAGVAMAGLAWMGRFLRPGIRDVGEWLTLDIAE
jgi:hypothetical protein